MSIIGIDLGLTTGFAVLEYSEGEFDKVPEWGKIICKLSKFDSYGMRALIFERELQRLIEKVLLNGRTLVAYESVRAHKGVDAAHVYGSLVSVLQKVCLNLEVNFVGIPVGTAKRVFTGKGNASKELVQRFALELTGASSISEDEADAVAVAMTAKELYGKQFHNYN